MNPRINAAMSNPAGPSTKPDRFVPDHSGVNASRPKDSALVVLTPNSRGEPVTGGQQLRQPGLLLHPFSDFGSPIGLRSQRSTERVETVRVHAQPVCSRLHRCRSELHQRVHRLAHCTALIARQRNNGRTQRCAFA
jgi:hypothetical protein